MTRIILALVLCIAAPLGAVAQSASSTNAAVLRWLDRTTGALQDFTLSTGQNKVMGALDIKLLACRYPTGEINRDAFALLSIKDINIDKEKFSGWMVASSPGLNALQHARYDVWVIRCSTS